MCEIMKEHNQKKFLSMQPKDKEMKNEVENK